MKTKLLYGAVFGFAMLLLIGATTTEINLKDLPAATTVTTTTAVLVLTNATKARLATVQQILDLMNGQTNLSLNGYLSLSGESNQLTVAEGSLLLDGSPITGGGDTIWTNDNGAIHLVDQSIGQDVRVATSGGLQGYVQQRSDVDTSEVLLRGGVWSLDAYGYGTTNGGAVFVITRQFSPTLTLLDPALDYGEEAPYIFNTYAPLTNGNILEVQNAGTNKFTVDYLGAPNLIGGATTPSDTNTPTWVAVKILGDTNEYRIPFYK